MNRSARSRNSPLGNERFLDPAVLSRIKSLPLVARWVVEGFIAGMHRSPYHGFSLDFAEYRPYSPGDDIRSVDWKVYARSDKFFVKKFEGDTNTRLYILLDCSKSMAFSSQTLSKHDYGRFLAACIAYLARRQNDAVGLLTFDSGVKKFTPPRARHHHFHTVLHHLEKSQAGHGTDIAGAMRELATLTRKRSIIVLISDFYQSPEEIAGSLRSFRHRGHDLVLFHILDPVELDPPFEGVATLEDMESGERLVYVPESRNAYQQRLARHLTQLRKECSEVTIDYELIDTSKPLDAALYRYLSARARKY